MKKTEIIKEETKELSEYHSVKTIAKILGIKELTVRKYLQEQKCKCLRYEILEKYQFPIDVREFVMYILFVMILGFFLGMIYMKEFIMNIGF